MTKLKHSAVRAGVIVDELETAGTAYETARSEFEIARQRFAAAKEKLISVRRLARDVLDAMEMYAWEKEHPDLRMVGLEIKDAILYVMRSYAVSAADTSLTSKDKRPYDPAMPTWTIVQNLDEHGFEWRTGTPRREVHAALLHLKGVTKVGNLRYAIAESDEIYKNMKEEYEKSVPF